MEYSIECCICYSIITPPSAILNCKHRFCNSCILQWKKEKNDCPLCRDVITSVKLDTEFDNKISSSSIDCEYRLCNATVSACELEKHMDNCIYNPEYRKKQRKETLISLNHRMNEIYAIMNTLNTEMKDVNDTYKIMRITLELYKNQFFEKALEWIHHLGTNFEKHTQTYLISMKFTILNDMGKYEEVRKICKNLGESTYKNSNVRLQHAIACIECGQYAESEVILHAMNDTQSAYVDHKINYVRGLLLKKQGRYYEAMKQLEEAKDIEENDHFFVLTHQALGDVYRKQEKFEKAKEHYTIVLSHLEEDAPEEAGVYYSLGCIHEKLGSYMESIKSYTRAINALPKDHPHLGIYKVKMADAKRLLSHFEQARTDYNEAVELIRDRLGEQHVELSDAYMGMGILYKKETKYEEALSQLSLALDLLRSNFEEGHYKIAHCLKNIGDVYRKKKMLVEAMDCYTSALFVFKKLMMCTDIADVNYEIGRVHFDEKDYKTAYQYFLQAIGGFILVIKSHEKLGMYSSSAALCKAMIGHYEEATDMFTNALKFFTENLGKEHPETADCYINIIEMYMKQLQEGNHEVYEQARTYCNDAKAIIQKAHNGHHPKLDTIQQYICILEELHL